MPQQEVEVDPAVVGNGQMFVFFGVHPLLIVLMPLMTVAYFFVKLDNRIKLIKYKI